MMNKHKQRGLTILVVLVLMSVMLLGGLALARMTEVGTLASGNNAYREAAMQASEIGLNTAFDAVKNVVDEGTAAGTWYRTTAAAVDANGIPVGIDFNAAALVTVGDYEVRYVVERMCTVAAVTDTLRECLVRQDPVPQTADFNAEKLEPPNSRQFRLTARITGPKGTQTWVQSLLTKGS